MPLEDHFGGDEGFHRFAIACEPQWGKCDFQQPLLSAVGGDLDVAIVCYYHLGDRALDWLESAVPALEGLTPLDCLSTEPGRRRLKECLWRMP